MADLKEKNNTFIQLNNTPELLNPDMLTDFKEAIDNWGIEQINTEDSLQKLRLSNVQKLNAYNKKQQEEMYQNSLRASQILIDRERQAKLAALEEEKAQKLEAAEKLGDLERDEVEQRIKEEYAKREKAENDLAKKKKKNAEKQLKEDRKNIDRLAKEKGAKEAAVGRT